MPEKAVWEVRLGVYATESEARQLVDEITSLLCPDAEHEPPCPIPWSVALITEQDLDEGDYSDLKQQYDIESR